MTNSRPLLALTSIRGMYPRRLSLILAAHRPDEAWDRLVDTAGLARSVHVALGEPVLAELSRNAASLAASSTLDELDERCVENSIGVAALGDADYPSLLAVDRDPPAVVFWRGDLAALDGRRVGIVGTRNASAAGRATATELGGALAAGGVAVVSGLARGIDGAAHRGVRELDGVAVAVVGNGLDRPYPRQNAGLWQWVAEHGLLISEWPPGTEPEGWRFPLRNRMIAALSEVLVVVESRAQGGSLITANEAIERGVEVMAVPGSTRHPAAAGTNALLRDGAHVIESIDDVRVLLGLSEHTQSARRQPSLPFGCAQEPDGLAAQVLTEVEATPHSLASLVERTGLPIHDLALALARLERDGWVGEVDGYFEATGSRLRVTSSTDRVSGAVSDGRP